MDHFRRANRQCVFPQPDTARRLCRAAGLTLAFRSPVIRNRRQRVPKADCVRYVRIHPRIPPGRCLKGSESQWSRAATQKWAMNLRTESPCPGPAIPVHPRRQRRRLPHARRGTIDLRQPGACGSIYEELNAIGEPTGERVITGRGERLPVSPFRFTWRLVARPKPDEAATPSN